MFPVALLMRTKTSNDLSVHQEWMDRDVVCIYNEVLFSHMQEGIPAIHNYMDRSEGHNVK